MPWHAQSGRTSLVVRAWLIETYMVFTICLFICISGVKSTLNQLSKQKSHYNKIKEINGRLPPKIIIFVLVTTLETNSPTPLSDSTASVSLPVPCPPLTAFAARFQRFPEMKLAMKFKTHCPQLTPAIALSVVPTMFGYSMYRLPTF